MAISSFIVSDLTAHATCCSSAYVALVLDKLWEPPKKKSDTEEERNDQNEEEPEEEEEPDEEEVEPSEQLPIEGDEKENEDQQEDSMNALDDSQGGQKGKQMKPPNYKKKVLLYVAATPDNKYLMNRQLNRKLGPVSYSVLLQGLPKLHIANVLYQEGIHFFQGLPRMGAYFTVPIVLSMAPTQVVALLCADTLKKEHTGSGCPFSIGEQDFIAAVSQAVSEVLASLYSVGESENTKDIMNDLQNQILQIEVSHRNELKRERDNRKTQASKPHEEEKGSSGIPNSQEEQEEVSNDKNELENEDEDDMKDEEDDDNIDKGDKDDGESIAVEGEDEDEQGEADDANEEGQLIDEGNKNQLHIAKQALKQQHKKVSNLEKKFEKCQAALEKQAFKVSKLEKQLQKSTGTLHHLHMLLRTVVDSIIKYKDQEFSRIKRILFPSTTIHRILKALLHVLGHGNATVDDWTRSRQLFNDGLCNALKCYDPLADNKDPKIWELCDIYLDGITQEELSKEAPIGYLCQQWLLAAKKVAIETIRHSTFKTKNERAAKDFADVELEQMVAEIDLRVAIDEEKKQTLHVEELQSTNDNANFTNERQISSSPTDEVDDEEGEDA